MKQAFKLSAILLTISAVFLFSCNDLISVPPGTVSVKLTADPVEVPAISSCDIIWNTNVETKYILEYGTTTGVYTYGTPLTATDSVSHTATIENLRDSTKYFFRITSYYQTYQKAVSAEYSFTTLPLNAITIQTGPSAVPGKYDCAITWTTNIATNDVVEYGTVTGTYTAATVMPAVASTAHTASLTGLAVSTLYYYRVKSVYQTGTPVLSAEHSFTTLGLTAITIDTAPIPTPLVNSCALNWTTNASVRHIVEYGTAAGIYSSATLLTSAASTSHAETLTGLSPATTYYYRIRSFYLAETESVSIEYSFATTAAPAPLALASAPASVPSYNSAAITYVTNYATTTYLEYGTAAGTYTGSLVLDTSNLSHTRTLSGLNANTIYYYRVYCFSAANGNLTSAELTFTTTVEPAPTLAQKLRGIWILGGISGATIGTTVANVDLFDPLTGAAGTWYTVSSLPTPVSFAGYAAYNGKLYIIGGFNSAGVVQTLVQIYDVAGNTWSTGIGLPLARANINAAVINDKIYVMGGTTGNASAVWAGSTTTYEYSPGGNLWTAKLAFSVTASSERFAYAVDSTIFNIGGRSSALLVAAGAHDGLIFTTNTLTAPAEVVMATPRTGVAGGVYKSSTGVSVVILAGGISVMTNITGCFVNQYTVAPTATFPPSLVQYLTNPFIAPFAWQAGTDTNFPSVAFGAGAVTTAVTPARFYYFGGILALGAGAAGQSAVNWSDLPTSPNIWSNTWTFGSPAMISGGRWGHGAVTLNN